MPEIPCPACRKRSRDTAICPRCGADLRALLEILRAATRALASGREHLKRGNGRDALEAAEIAWRLHRTDEAAKLGFLACLQLRRWEGASGWYGRVRGAGSGTSP